MTYGEQMKLIDKEIEVAKQVGRSSANAIPRSGKLFGGKSKPYTESQFRANAANWLWQPVPAKVSWTPGLGALGTLYAIDYFAIPYIAKGLDKGEDLGREIIWSFGVPRENIIQDKRSKAIKSLEYKNTAAYLQGWLNPMEHYEIETMTHKPFEPDLLFDSSVGYPEYDVPKAQY